MALMLELLPLLLLLLVAEMRFSDGGGAAPLLLVNAVTGSDGGAGAGDRCTLLKLPLETFKTLNVVFEEITCGTASSVSSTT